MAHGLLSLLSQNDQEKRILNEKDLRVKLVLSQTQPIHVGDRVVARCQTPRGPKTYHGTLVHLSVNGALVQTEDTMESIPPADLRKDDEATPG